jgi:hypothetical protein
VDVSGASCGFDRRADGRDVNREVLVRRVCRIGVQTIEREGARYFITIKNRTYSSEHEVSAETARRYYASLKRK